MKRNSETKVRQATQIAYIKTLSSMRGPTAADDSHYPRKANTSTILGYD